MSHRGSLRGRFPAGILLALVALCVFGTVAAQIPSKINYQGRLTDASTAPITNPSLPMVFKLYNVPAGGSALFTEIQTVAVTNGIFDVALGTNASLTLPFDVQYYLGVQVGADAEMTPRQAVLSSPYALNAAALAASATVPTSQLGGTIGTAQIADAAVTQAKLSAIGGTAGKVLGTDGANLQWQSAGAVPAPATTVAPETTFGLASAVGTSANYARADHTHGTPPPNGDLASVLVGGIQNINVVGLRGRAVANTVPTDGQVLSFNNGVNRWEPATPATVPPAPVIRQFAGQGGTIAANPSANYVFVGPTALVTVPSGGRITSSASLPISSSVPAIISIGICYQPSAGGTLTLLAGGGNFQVMQVTNTVTMINSHGSLGGIGAGNFNVGLCVNNGSGTSISTTDWVNGWVMATAS